MQSMFSIISPARIGTDSNMKELKHVLDVSGKKVLEIGCGNNSYKKWFPKADWLATDFELKGDAEEIADVTNLKFEDESFDAIVCISVLEHVFDFNKAINEMKRVLKKSGNLILVVPFMYPYHDYPGDFWRFTDKAIEKLLIDFSELKIKKIASFWWRLPMIHFVIAKK